MGCGSWEQDKPQGIWNEWQGSSFQQAASGAASACVGVPPQHQRDMTGTMANITSRCLTNSGHVAGVAGAIVGGA